MQNNDAVNEMMRGECFRFLAVCFYPPKKEVLGTDHLLPSLTQNLQTVCPAATTFAHQMHASFGSYTEEELAVEHARLFVGPFDLKAPPYGSVYLDGERTVMGPSTMETIRHYEEEGLVRDEEFSDLPDHISVELEFIYYLIYRRVEALEKGETEKAQMYLQKEEDFRHDFLGRWVPSFCRNIIDESDNSFYKALAECLNAITLYS